MSAMRLTELRCTGAAVGLLLVLLVVAPAGFRVSRREIPLLAAYGVAGVALTQCFYFVAIARMPVSIALLLEYTAPLMVALWARFVFRQPVRNRVWAALGLSLVGLALVAEVWQGSTLDGVGVAAALAAAVALAAYYLLGEHSASSRDPLSTTFWAFVFASLFWAVVQPWWTFPVDETRGSTSLLGNLDDVSLPLWTLMLCMVVLGTIVPFVLVLSGLHHLPATRVGMVGMLEPVLAGVVAWAWLERGAQPASSSSAAPSCWPGSCWRRRRAEAASRLTSRPYGTTLVPPEQAGGDRPMSLGRRIDAHREPDRCLDVPPP